MQTFRILVAVASWNRPNVTRLCLENLQQIRGPNAAVMIYDDNSSAYDEKFLSQYCDGLLKFRIRGGIERSRARAFRDFVHRYSDFDLLYLTDNDTVHDPSFIRILNEIFSIQRRYPYSHPVGLFRSVFHENAIEKDLGDFLTSKTCPGVSQAYNREMAEKIVHLLDSNPQMETVYGWDYHWPNVLQRPFLISKHSYLDHLGRDINESGLHCKKTGTSARSFLRDYNRDRALNKTDPLEKISHQARLKLIRLLNLQNNQEL
jgi:hypothetical protein